MKEKHPWAKALAEAIDQWAGKKGIPKTDIAARLDIPPSVWGGISGGNSISKTEYYARLFVYTGIRESDPRSVPPRPRTFPRGGKKEEIRAWSETEYREWYSREGGKWLSMTAVPRHSGGTGVPVSPAFESKSSRAGVRTPGELIGQAIDQILDRLALSPSTPLLSGEDVTTKALAEQLRVRLASIFMMDSEEERDKVLKELLPVLVTLKEVLQILISPRTTREESIMETRSVGNE